MCCEPDGQGFDYRQRRKDFSGELGQCSTYNCAAGRMDRGSNTGRSVRIFLGSWDSVARTTVLLAGRAEVWIPAWWFFLGPPNLLFNGYRYPFSGTVGPDLHDNSCPYTAEVKNEWSYTPAPPIRLYGVDRVNYKLHVGYFNSSVNVC